MKVQLMLTCLCDAIYGEVGIATVRVLEHLGCEVVFPKEQTCCGQPPFNAGDWNAARPVAERTVSLFGLEVPVVTPSASCAAMVRHGYSQLLDGVEVPKTYELCEYIVKVCGREKWEGSVVPRKVGLHRACHGRALGLTDEQERLLSSISGVELVEIGSPEQCCGFGGAFSVTHGKTSEGIGLEKLQVMKSAGVEQIVSGDMGCLAHLDGLISRHHIEMKTAHIAEVLSEALDG